MFQLTRDELSLLKSQFVISNAPSPGASRSQIVILKRGYNVKYPPYAFTEQGVAMLSSVLRSKRAIRVNVEIMRAFVRLRKMLASHVDLARKLDSLEKIRCPIQGGFRRHPSLNGRTGNSQKENRFPGKGKTSGIRQEMIRGITP
jgi:hypothetical protein